MSILEFLYNLVTYQCPGMEDVTYAITFAAFLKSPLGSSLASSVLGSIFGSKRGKRQQREAERLRREAIESLPKSPIQEIVDFSQQSKDLAGQTLGVGKDIADRNLQASINYLQSIDPRSAGVIPNILANQALQERQLQTKFASDVLQSEAPLVQAAQNIQDMETKLALQDIGSADAAFQAGAQARDQAISNLMNIPGQIATLYASAPDEESRERLIQPMFGEEGGYIKSMALGGTLADIISKRESGVEQPTREDIIQNMTLTGMTGALDRARNLYGQRSIPGVPGVAGVLEMGDSMVTDGVEEHSVNEKAIVDLEDGGVEALVTGQERVENAEDGVAVTNSEQERGMFDAFAGVKDKKNPTEEEMKMVYAAVAKVYTQPQFNPKA